MKDDDDDKDSSNIRRKKILLIVACCVSFCVLVGMVAVYNSESTNNKQQEQQQSNVVALVTESQSSELNNNNDNTMGDMDNNVDNGVASTIASPTILTDEEEEEEEQQQDEARDNNNIPPPVVAQQETPWRDITSSPTGSPSYSPSTTTSSPTTKTPTKFRTTPSPSIRRTTPLPTTPFPSRYPTFAPTISTKYPTFAPTIPAMVTTIPQLPTLAPTFSLSNVIAEQKDTSSSSIGADKETTDISYIDYVLSTTDTNKNQGSNNEMIATTTSEETINSNECTVDQILASSYCENGIASTSIFMCLGTGTPLSDHFWAWSDVPPAYEPYQDRDWGWLADAAAQVQERNSYGGQLYNTSPRMMNREVKGLPNGRYVLGLYSNGVEVRDEYPLLASSEFVISCGGN